MIASQLILHGCNENEGETFSTAMNTSPLPPVPKGVNWYLRAKTSCINYCYSALPTIKLFFWKEHWKQTRKL